MATFGPIASSQPNVLFSPMAVDQAVQTRERNALAMDISRDDQRQKVFERDRDLASRVAGAVLAAPADQQDAEYARLVGLHQAQGLLPHAPARNPGAAHLASIRDMGLSTEDRLKLDETRRQNDAFRAMFGLGGALPAPAADVAPTGGAGALAGPLPPAPGPAAGGDIRANNRDFAAQREAVLADASLPPEEQQRRLAAISAAQAGTNSGLPTGPGYRAPAGVGGAFAGLPPPTGQVGPIGAPGGAPAPPATPPGGAAGRIPGAVDVAGAGAPPAAPAAGLPPLNHLGLTQQQSAQVLAAGPTRGLALMAQFQQQNRMERERASDDARHSAERSQDVEFRRAAEARAAEAARLAAERDTRMAAAQAEAARRADEAAKRADDAAARRESTLPPALVEMRQETEDKLAGLTSARNALDEAAKLSARAYAGPGALTRGRVAGVTGYDAETAKATTQFNSIMTEQALSQLRSIFGGNPTEGERKILVDMQASPSMSRAERDALIVRAQEAVRIREAAAQRRLTEIRQGTYGRVDPNYTPPPAAPPPPPGGGSQGGGWSIRPVQ